MIACQREGAENRLKMWNGKCKTTPDETVVAEIDVNLNARNGLQHDAGSVLSVSSEDISTIISKTSCCHSDATNPTLKRGRQFQLSQVSPTDCGLSACLTSFLLSRTFCFRFSFHLFCSPLVLLFTIKYSIV